MVGVQLNIVKDVVRAVTDGRPGRQLLFGVDHLIRAVAQEKLGVHVARRARYHKARAQVLQQRGGFQRALKIVSDGHDAHIEIAHPQRRHELLVLAVADLRAGHIGQRRLHALLAPVYGHNLMPELMQLDGNMASKPSQTDQQNGFHLYPLLFPIPR